jgi:hypothetical protein
MRDGEGAIWRSIIWRAERSLTLEAGAGQVGNGDRTETDAY